jgi:hypothetical protein
MCCGVPIPTDFHLGRLRGICRLFPKLYDSLAIVRPDTVIRWHRAGFRLYWRWKSRHRCGRPTVPLEIRRLIREMSANSLWGRTPSAPRAAVVPGLLQWRAHSPVIEQGRAEITRRGDSRTHYLSPDPGRTALPIRPDLICGRDTDQGIPRAATARRKYQRSAERQARL